ncbi:glycerol-3-phosphate dehydrogenase [Nakamurella sp. UYEF19]|uniref:glycerol-3-phosphate dehydrogenase/oxidase n=1 Tax=Nakamurella sp. UYEF19 TaxID=1756392 RepID=UPI003398BD52
MTSLRPGTSTGPHPDMPTGQGRLNLDQRAADLGRATQETADVLVIGAGVTGAGCALDAATRGLSVVVIEADDIAIGTSSRSGKTFHGGLRYLEQLNFGLVHHAIVERDLMVRTVAPYISRPVPFLYPLTKHWERPYAGAGILIYDLFGLRGKAVPKQRHFTRRGAVKQAPSLDGSTVTGGIRYYDVLMDDARHTMAVLRTAASYGAKVVTKAPVVDYLRDGERITGVVVEDRLTDARHELRAKVVINAAGIWSSDLQKLAGANTFTVAPAKGVHLLLRGDAIDAQTAILARATDSIIIARPWLGHWLVGTTDTPWDGTKGEPVAEVEDIEYLLRELNVYLKKKVTADDVLGVFAGLRPLLKPIDKDGETTSALSRDHSIIPGPDGLVTIVGGKYTTYRLMAQDTIDAAVKSAGLKGVPPSPTARTPLVGAAGYAALVNRFPLLAREFDLPLAQIERLAFRYGSLLEDVLALGASDSSLRTPRADWGGYLPAELIYAVTAEGALTLKDVLVRRTHLAIELPDGGLAAAGEIAALLAPVIGWDEATTATQVEDYLSEVESDRAALEKLRAGVKGERKPYSPADSDSSAPNPGPTS